MSSQALLLTTSRGFPSSALVTEATFDVVTGAFSFTGGFIARRLLAEGRSIRTLTNHPRRPGADDINVEVAPLQFSDYPALV
jgi:hypothetical protein